MNLRLALKFVLVALAAMISLPAFAQLVTSGMTGFVRGADGQPIAGATVTAVYTPTNATFTAITNEQGRYNFRGLEVGGPYTVSASATGFSGEPVTGITSLLGRDVDVNFTLRSDVVTLERFVTTANTTDLDSSAIGTRTVLDQQVLSAKPTSERSLADIISASSLVTLRSTFGDREESQITAVGQNNRFNSIQIDGSRINDHFGLNGTGLASFFNPLSLDTIEQLDVAISPYDVRQSGFTGASINAVTKSGTNEFKGSLYYYFRGDELFGLQMQGENLRESVGTGVRFVPPLERSTFGATLGGPILRDKLFFFVTYEEFESTSAGRDARADIGSTEQQILSRLDQISSAAGEDINWGSPVTGRTANTSTDEKISAKLNWNINRDHRFNLRYTTTEGEVPQFGAFGNSTFNQNNIRGGIVHSSSGHFYSQTREEKTIAAQLFSQWSPNFKTEVLFSDTSQDQLTPVNAIAPQIAIHGLTATDLTDNRTVTDAVYVVGTEQFRQGNVILVDSQQISAIGEYFWENFVFSGGIEREQTDFYNLFRQGSYGLISFRSLSDFLADTNAVMSRNAYDPGVRNVADISEMATTGIFGQAKWDVNTRLSLLAGLRYEFVESGRADLNQAFQAATGFRNDGTPDGTSALSPRVGFNFSFNEERTTQLRGGVGHFFGRAPWVIFSNSYGQTGVGGFTLQSASNQLPTSLGAYLATHFDPSNPIATGTDNPTLRREVNWVDEGTELPQVWRANLALEQRLPILDSILTFEVVRTESEKALFITNENVRPLNAPAADGRARFSGAPFTQANARFAGYTDLLRVRNVKAGDSTFFTVQLDRPMRNRWGMNLSYTHGEATEAQAIGQTTAGGQWNRNVVFNQNTIEEGTADFEIKHRVQFSYTRQFEFIRNHPTTMSLYYEGRSGNPYSWVYGSDLNGDGRSDNDTIAVPSGVNDPRFDFSEMSAAERDLMFAFFRSSGLDTYAGGIVPKNSFTEPWVNRLDLKLIQNIPIRGDTKLSLFFDFINFGAWLSEDLFGYQEIVTSLNNDVFRKRFIGNATYAADGRIRPTFTSLPTGIAIDNGMARWRIQLGAKLEF